MQSHENPSSQDFHAALGKILEGKPSEKLKKTSEVINPSSADFCRALMQVLTCERKRECGPVMSRKQSCHVICRTEPPLPQHSHQEPLLTPQQPHRQYDTLVQPKNEQTTGWACHIL